MKTLHISASDVAAGADRAAYNIHRSLMKAGAESAMLVKARLTQDPSVTRYEPSMNPLARATRLVRRQWQNWTEPMMLNIGIHGMFSGCVTPLGGELAARLPAAEVINLHWITGFVDVPAFVPVVAGRTPLVWTLHDMNPFTGGCHYDCQCARFTGQCGRCPVLGATTDTDRSRRTWLKKKAAFDRVPADRLKLVTPSRWLGAEAARSSLFKKFEVTTIPYGVDTFVFAPRDKRFAREALGIPPGVRVVAFVASSLRDERKGHRPLMEALGQMENIFLLSVGRGAPVRGAASLHLGHIDAEPLMALVYNAADVFAAPSIADNLPQTVLEAMACSLPVVGSRTGGIPDAVRDGETGLVVPPGDARELRAAIEAVVGDEPRQAAMAARARAVAEADYSYARQAASYLQLYHRILGAP